MLPTARRTGPVLAVLGGFATGGLAAVAYYDDSLWPIAHTFALWIGLAVLLSIRQPTREAVVRVGTGRGAAVIAFFYGKDLMYAELYAGPYSVNRSVKVQWLLLALVAGALLGSVFARIGGPGWLGAAAAFATGLILADAYRRIHHYPGDAPAVRSSPAPLLSPCCS